MDNNTVISYWKKSLEFFKRDNLKLYFLVTLNTLLRSSKILLRNFWWLLIIDLICAWIGTPELYLVSTGINGLLLYLTIMTVRPSLEAKNFGYYLGYLQGIWLILLLFFIAYYAGNVFAFVLLPLPFFFFDSNLSAWSFVIACKQWAKMVLFFAPILAALLIIPIFSALIWTLIVFAIFSSPTTLFQFSVFRVIVFSLLYPVFYFFIIINISAISVLYTKLKHENFNLLF